MWSTSSPCHRCTMQLSTSNKLGTKYLHGVLYQWQRRNFHVDQVVSSCRVSGTRCPHRFLYKTTPIRALLQKQHTYNNIRGVTNILITSARHEYDLRKKYGRHPYPGPVQYNNGTFSRATDSRLALETSLKVTDNSYFWPKPVTILSPTFFYRYTNLRPIILRSGRIIFSIWPLNNGRLSDRTSGRP